GAMIFNNQGDYAGCFRVYEGALLTTRPLLGKYPELQKAIDQGLAEANSLPRMHDRAHALRRVIDEIRYTMSPDLRPAAKSLWDRLGGERGVAKITFEIMQAAAADPKVNFSRGGKFNPDKNQLAALHKSLVTFVSSATGGPYKYTGRSMKEVHKGMGITNAEFDAFV